MDKTERELEASVPENSPAHDLSQAQTADSDGKEPKNVRFQAIPEDLQSTNGNTGMLLKVPSLYDDQSEEFLIEQAELGNEEAFQVLQKRYEPKILSFIIRMLQDYEVGLELTQDTFLKAWLSLSARDQKRTMKFRPWLYRIGYTTTIDYLRRYPLARSSVSIEGMGEKISKHSSWNEGIEYDYCQRESIRAALQQVSPQYRRCIIMKFVEGYTDQEIAHALGISKVTVRVNIFRGREQLYQAYMKEIGVNANEEERK